MKKDIKSKIWFIIVGIILLVYAGIFCYLNMAKYAQHVDSDIAAEALWAREIWENKTLTPDNWIGSTKRYIFGMPTLASVFYGMTGSMETAVGIACILLSAAFLAVLYVCLRKLEISKTGVLAAMLILCALPINGIRNEGQMVPYVTLLLFLFADYYVLHSIHLFAGIGFYLHLKEKGEQGEHLNLWDGILWFVLFGFTIVLSFESQRSLQVSILPLLIYEVICLFQETQGFAKKVPKNRWITTGFVLSNLIAYVMASMYNGQTDYGMHIWDAETIVNRFLIEVPTALLEGFGLAGNVQVGSFASIMQLLIWAFLALVVYGIVYICRKKNLVMSKQREALLLLLLSVGITVAIIVMTTVEALHNYFFVAWFVAMFATVVLIDAFRKKKAWFADIILLAICGFALLNINYTWKDAITTTDNLQAYEEVADFMVEEGIEYGYGEFWDAGRIAMVRDGAVTMGCAYTIEELKMYWWLTSTEWYPPNLPTDMKTAYVVRVEKKDGFLAQFENQAVLDLQFENDKFAVFVSGKNLMKMQ